MTAATSSGVPNRPSGMIAFSAATFSGSASVSLLIGVAIAVSPALRHVIEYLALRLRDLLGIG